MATDADVCLIASSISLFCSLRMEETSDRWRITKHRDDVRKHHVVSLRPASLFRSVGLTGLSVSLPPHRRLRSIINKTQNTSTATGQSDHLCGRVLSDSVSGGAEHHQPSTNSLNSSSFSGRSQDKTLPTITSLYQILPEKKTRAQREIHIKNQMLSHQRVNPTARTCGGDTSPVEHTESEYYYEEVWRRVRQKLRWTRIRRNTRDDVSDISQRIQNLKITESHQRGRGNRAVPVGKEEGQTRRDRRPHFLPPITQSDCLLTVPLTLPDNSPPPSPCSPSDVLFFPLSVPQI